MRHVVETKQGLNHGRNRGIAEARFDHLVYLDDDMIVDGGWLHAYAETQAEFEADCVAGLVEPWFEQDPPTWMTPATIRSVTSAYTHKGERPLLLPKGQSHQVPGSNFGVLRAVALEVGGFHPDLDRCGSAMLAGGDFEFGERLALSGKRVVYSPGCRIRHFISKQKIAAEGLRARWQGSGATGRALMQLRGERPTAREGLRKFLTMVRLGLRSLRFRLQGDAGRAFETELQAREIFGFLFSAPRGLKAREAVQPAGARDN